MNNLYEKCLYMKGGVNGVCVKFIRRRGLYVKLGVYLLSLHMHGKGRGDNMCVVTYTLC